MPAGDAASAADKESCDHRRPGPRRRQQIQAELGQIGLVLPGSLTDRTTRCQRAGCHCHADPPQLHGPYPTWTRKVSGRTVTRTLTTEDAERLPPTSPPTATCASSSPNSKPSPSNSPTSPRYPQRRKTSPAKPEPVPDRRTRPKRTKHREISPLNPGTAPRRTPVTADHPSSVVSPDPFPHIVRFRGECLPADRQAHFPGSGAAALPGLVSGSGTGPGS